MGKAPDYKMSVALSQLPNAVITKTKKGTKVVVIPVDGEIINISEKDNNAYINGVAWTLDSDKSKAPVRIQYPKDFDTSKKVKNDDGYEPTIGWITTPKSAGNEIAPAENQGGNFDLDENEDDLPF